MDTETSPPPILLSYEPPPVLPPRRHARILAVPLLCVICAWTVGTSTNAVNGMVSRVYFNLIVGWMYGGNMTLRDVVFQGAMESSVFGIIFAVIFTIIYAATTQARCELKLVERQLTSAFVIAIACWLAGGAIGVMWAGGAPDNFRTLFIMPITLTRTECARWGFVGDRSGGVYAGGCIVAIFTCITVQLRWKKGASTA